MLASELLRQDLLEGTSVLVAGATEPDAHFSSAVDEACTELGARVHVCAPDVAEEAVAEIGSLDLLAVDGAGLFVHGGLRTCLDMAWSATHAVANLAFLPRAEGGRIVYIAPAPSAGEHADAARAGLENLSRTLSIEWARHGITTVTIALGDDTSASEVGAIVAYLASPAGAYFSGCLLDLRGV
ncbi:MAG TPA: hypothetical protein VGG98_03160 [Solirubrobacteraceae bacterium]